MSARLGSAPIGHFPFPGVGRTKRGRALSAAHLGRCHPQDKDARDGPVALRVILPHVSWIRRHIKASGWPCQRSVHVPVHQWPFRGADPNPSVHRELLCHWQRRRRLGILGSRVQPVHQRHRVCMEGRGPASVAAVAAGDVHPFFVLNLCCALAAAC